MLPLLTRATVLPNGQRGHVLSNRLEEATQSIVADVRHVVQRYVGERGNG